MENLNLSHLSLAESSAEHDSRTLLYVDLATSLYRLAPSASRGATLQAALSCWMAFAEVQPTTRVGDELLETSAELIEDFQKWMRVDIGLAASTAHKRMQQLKQIAACAQALISTDRLPGTFANALRMLISRSMQTIGAIAKTTSIDKSTLNGWLRGGRLQNCQRAAVLRLEQHFRVLPGTLSERADFLETAGGRRSRTTFGKRRSEQVAASRSGDKLWMLFNYISEEWRDYVEHKCDDMRPEVIDAPNPAHPPVWRAKRLEDCGIRPQPQMMMRSGLVVPSAGVAYGHIATFLGWRKKQFGLSDVDSSTIAWLVDHQGVYSHAAWKAERSGGIWHSGVRDFLTQVITMTRPESGYLWQNPEFSRRIINAPSILGYEPAEQDSVNFEERWKSTCLATHLRVKKLLKAKFPPSKETPIARNPQESLHEFMTDRLPLKRFLQRLVNYAQRMQLRPWTRGRIKAERDVLLLLLLAANPLRISQYAMMQYRLDNTGNLYQDSLQGWRIRFKAEDFKNTKGAAHRHYDVPVPASLWSRIKYYLTAVRPMLLDSATCDFVFLPTSGAKRDAYAAMKGGMWDSSTIVDSLGGTVSLAIPEAKGFGAHSMRHLVATHYLRVRPGDVEGLASILNDTIGTVRKTYLSRLTEPVFERIAESFDEVFESLES